MFYEVRVIIHAVNKIKKEQGRNVNLSADPPELEFEYLGIYSIICLK